MSAFICNTETFNNIYSGLKVFYKTDIYWDTKQQIHTMLETVKIPGNRTDLYKTVIAELYALNVEAVNQRYGEATTTNLEDWQLTEMCTIDPDISDYQFLKSLVCLLYQMNEGRVPFSPLYKAAERLRDAICRDIVSNTDMYSSAKWG